MIIPGFANNVEITNIEKGQYDNGGQYIEITYKKSSDTKEMSFEDMLNSGMGAQDSSDSRVRVNAPSHFINGAPATKYNSDEPLPVGKTVDKFYNFNSLIRHIFGCFLTNDQMNLAKIIINASKKALPQAKFNPLVLETIFGSAEIYAIFMEEYLKSIENLYKANKSKIDGVLLNAKFHRSGSIDSPNGHYVTHRLMNYAAPQNTILVPADSGIELVANAVETKYNWLNPKRVTLEAEEVAGSPNGKDDSIDEIFPV